MLFLRDVHNASPATIRRDLIKLDQEGVISRTHGGVTLNRFIHCHQIMAFQEVHNLL
jgi:DeoR/GlpR family transcriptional regulator of sugar metabolism